MNGHERHTQCHANIDDSLSPSLRHHHVPTPIPSFEARQRCVPCSATHGHVHVSLRVRVHLQFEKNVATVARESGRNVEIKKDAAMSGRRRHRVAMANGRRLRQTKFASRGARRPFTSLSRCSEDDALIITEHDPLQITSTMHDWLTEVLVQIHHRRRGDGPGRPTEAVPRCVLSRHATRRRPMSSRRKTAWIENALLESPQRGRRLARSKREMKDIVVGLAIVQPKLSGTTTVRWRGGQMTATFATGSPEQIWTEHRPTRCTTCGAMQSRRGGRQCECRHSRCTTALQRGLVSR